RAGHRVGQARAPVAPLQGKDPGQAAHAVGGRRGGRARAAVGRPALGRTGPGRPTPGVRAMSMSDFVVREAIVPALTSTTKEAVIREIVESLRATGYVPADVSEDIVRAILKREQLGSTGIGRGIAIPHTKHPSVDRLTGTVALSQGG